MFSSTPTMEAMDGTHRHVAVLVFSCLLTAITESALAGEVKLTASDGAASDFFGYSVSVSGGVALIGARYDDDNGYNSGSAYVYRFNGSTWVEEQKLIASDVVYGDYFGAAVALSGEVAVIGAHADDEIRTDSGSAYVYRFNGSTWDEEDKLSASDSAGYDHFGSSVSVSGDVAVIGAHSDDDNGCNSGSAYVYRLKGDKWVEEQKLTASDGAASDLFGYSISVSGDVALIGAYYDDNGTGSAYVYRFNGSTWVEEQKLTASDGATSDLFGYSVSVSGEVAMIGAHSDDDNGSWSGSAYVYRFNGSTWAEEQKLIASDGVYGDYFGTSVSVSGDVAVIGANSDDDNGCNSGSAYVYRFNGSTWVEEEKLIASDGAGYDHFGSSVSISGNVPVIGAWGDDDAGSASGSAYLFLIGLDCDGDLVPDDFETDSDRDSVIDDCDDCPNTLPGTPVDEVGCPLVLNAAASRRQHGNSGAFNIALALDGSVTIEPRLNFAVPQMVLTYDQAPADPGCANITITNGTCISTCFSGNDLIIDMNFDENACIEITVGEDTLQILTHTGNVNGDDDANVIDLQEVKNHVFEPVDARTCKYDINCDGAINVIDLQETKNNVFTPMPTCE